MSLCQLSNLWTVLLYFLIMFGHIPRCEVNKSDLGWAFFVTPFWFVNYLTRHCNDDPMIIRLFYIVTEYVFLLETFVLALGHVHDELLNL